MIDEKEQEQENTIETPLPNDELLELEEKSKLNKKLNKKIISRCLIFILCSLLYLLILVVRISGSGHDMQKQFIHSFVNAIMYVSFAVSIICVIFLLLLSFSNKIREKIDKVKLKTKKVLFTILDYAVIFPACATIASFCFAFIFSFAIVDGESMLPTIQNNSTVFVSYLEKVERFDIVVAYITEEDNTVENLYGGTYPEYYIKRVIGIPGDKLTWQSGVLTINDQVVDEYYFDDATKNSHRLDGAYRDFDGTFKYKYNGETLTSLIIPEGYYFVMGDNRRVSRDSREVGLIPSKNIEGVVKVEFDGLSIKKVK